MGGKDHYRISKSHVLGKAVPESRRQNCFVKSTWGNSQESLQGRSEGSKTRKGAEQFLKVRGGKTMQSLKNN